jgi:predicted DNA-binding transcriptional regulator AlpA
MTRALHNYAPRLLRLEGAANYLGMGRSKFQELVSDGRLPKPIHLDGMRLWDRQTLDSVADDLVAKSDEPGRPNSFDQVLDQ